MFHCGLFPPARHILRIWLAPEEGPHALISRMPDERFQAQPYCFSVCRGAASSLGLLEEMLVDVKRLLHMYDYAIHIWLNQPPKGAWRLRLGRSREGVDNKPNLGR